MAASVSPAGDLLTRLGYVLDRLKITKSNPYLASDLVNPYNRLDNEQLVQLGRTLPASEATPIFESITRSFGVSRDEIFSSMRTHRTKFIGQLYAYDSQHPERVSTILKNSIQSLSFRGDKLYTWLAYHPELNFYGLDDSHEIRKTLVLYSRIRGASLIPVKSREEIPVKSREEIPAKSREEIPVKSLEEIPVKSRGFLPPPRNPLNVSPIQFISDEEAFFAANTGNFPTEENFAYLTSSRSRHSQTAIKLPFFQEVALFPPNVIVAGWMSVFEEKNSEILLKLASIIISDPQIYLLNLDQLRFLLTHDYWPFFQKDVPESESEPAVRIPHLADSIARLEILSGYPDNVIQLLGEEEIDANRLNGLNWMVYIALNPTPRFLALLKIFGPNLPANLNLNEVAIRVGMVVPPQSRNSTEYFWNNIADYESVIDRPAGLIVPTISEIMNDTYRMTVDRLKKLTDTEIVVASGAYVNYNSRRRLIQKTLALRERGVFIPMIRRCGNSETTVNLEDPNDPNFFVIGLGTLSDYQCWEIADFLGSIDYIEDDSGERTFYFQFPNRSPILQDEQTELLNLMRDFRNLPGATDLIERIRMGQRVMKENELSDEETLRRFEKFPVEYQPAIREYLMDLFLTGMYMRRWGGPGCAYPLQESQTKAKEIPDVAVSERLKENERLLNSLPLYLSTFLRQLKAVGIREGRLEQENTPMSFYVQEVSNERQCIRIGSSHFVGTGYYYTRMFFNELIPGIDLTQYQGIS